MKESTRSLNNPFLALRHKNFSLYMAGMAISLIGTWMQNLAQPWLAYQMTDSPLLLSLVGAMEFVPVMLLSLHAGVLVDRIPKKKILLFTQSASLLVMLVLATLVWLGHIHYWHILLCATALGCINAFDLPARQAFVIEMVGKEDLVNAIALNSSVFNIARVLGPGLAGILMSVAGVASCFYFNALSFSAVLISLFFIKPVAQPVAVNRGQRISKSILEGLCYIRSEKNLLRTVLLLLIVCTFGMNTNVLTPVFSDVVLHQQESGFGFLMSFLGVGSFAGAMVVASRSKNGASKFLLTVFPYFVAVALLFVSLTNTYAASAFGHVLTGFFFVAFCSTANSVLQLNTKSEFRGRVMSIYALVLGGSTPIGNLFSGVIMDLFGPKAGFAACGAMIAVLLAVLMLAIQYAKKRNRHAAESGMAQPQSNPQLQQTCGSATSCK